MISISKRGLARLISASAMVATLAVAAGPTAALAAEGDTVVVKGVTLTVMHLNPTAPVTGDIDASRFDIGVYFGPGHSGTVTADISGAKHYGIVVDGATVNVTGSKVHHIGDNPFGLNGIPAFSGNQYGNAIYYYNGASGTISGNQVSKFQKNGITVTGKAANYLDPATPMTSASVTNNTVTGEGDITYIAQNGIQISYGAIATVVKNTVSGFNYTPDGTVATGLLLYDAGRVNVQNNKISKVTNEVDIFIKGTTTGHVKP